MFKKKLRKISENVYELPKENGMNVSGKIFISDSLLDNLEEGAIEQVRNVANLPGIVGTSIAMPDIHQGYGLAIGGVAAFDAKNGIITPGGVGFDINCGVRVLSSSLSRDEVLPKIDELLNYFLKFVSVGVGSESKIHLSEKELAKVLETGVRWAIDNGFGLERDLEVCEEGGCLEGANSRKVSQKARGRGRNQLGTLGSGNHFIEVSYVDEIYDKDIAKVFGIKEKGQILVMIHSGSRGIGHQVAQDYIDKIKKEFRKESANLPEENLVYAPLSSEVAQDYLSAMRASANYAWCNRQVMSHYVRESFGIVFADKKLDLIYDVCHNIAKFEEYKVNGKKRMLCVHRKGATRAFGPGNPNIPKMYQGVGQPIILPGSMGTYSYILAGTKKAEEVSFSSCSHGAGRALSRNQALKQFDGKKVLSELKDMNITVRGSDYKGVAEEGPGAYKDVSEVVKVISELGIGKMVVRLKPIGVIKG